MEEDTSDIIQWHKAFHEAIQLELEEYRDMLNATSVKSRSSGERSPDTTN